MWEARTIAVSVGSPICCSFPSLNVTEPSQHSVPYSKSFMISALFSKNISIAKANIDVCNSNMDSVNKTLENIDMYYFSDTEEVLEDKIHPKVKKYKYIKE